MLTIAISNVYITFLSMQMRQVLAFVFWCLVYESSKLYQSVINRNIFFLFLLSSSLQALIPIGLK